MRWFGSTVRRERTRSFAAEEMFVQYGAGNEYLPAIIFSKRSALFSS
jgi:hypothetical protein